MPLLLFVLPLLSTLAGGALALRLRRYVSALMALGAGLLLGAAFLDLLPEAISLGAQSQITSATVLGMALGAFFLFYLLESVLDALARRWRSHGVEQRVIGRVSAVMLILHSLRDGLAIGATYAASHPAGYAVAFAIAAHDLGDGMNTVLLSTAGDRPSPVDYAFLAADAIAPVLGILLTICWHFSVLNSVGLLVLAAGFFLHMATANFLPEIRRRGDAPLRFVPAVLLGASVIYVANVIILKQ